MSKRKKVEIEVINVTYSQEQAGAYALVFKEVNGTRKLPVIIGTAEAQAILIILKGFVPPRPLTHNLFASCLDILGVSMERAILHKVENGVFYSYIYIKADETIIRMDSRTSDAVAMALYMKAPIFVYEDILEEERLMVEEDEEPKSNTEKDYDLLDTDLEQKEQLLKRALKKAIAKEEYEQAAQIRDELNKIRKTKE